MGDDIPAPGTGVGDRQIIAQSGEKRFFEAQADDEDHGHGRDKERVIDGFAGGVRPVHEIMPDKAFF